MKPCEVHVDDDSLVFGFSFLFLFFHCFVGLSSVDKELLRGSSRLGNDVRDAELFGSDVDALPSLSIIPSELNFLGVFLKFRRDNESTMISNIVDVVSYMRRFPGDSTITGNVEVLA